MSIVGGRAASILIGLATAIVIVAVAILPFLTTSWVAFEQGRANATAWTGYSTAELRSATDAILADLVLGGDFTVEVDGQPVLNDRERGHMADVRTVFRGLWILAVVSVVVLAIGALRAERARAWRAVRQGALGLTVGVVVVGIVGLVAFDQLFELFHRIFFPAGSYLFDPSTDRLVQLFPFQFWQETADGGRRRHHRDRAARGAGRRSPRGEVHGRSHRAGSRDRAGAGIVTAPVAPGLLSVEAALDAILAVAEPVSTQSVRSADALGRITAETVVARVSLPPWPNSAMDGYAIRAADTTDATEAAPVELRVIGDIAAGAAPNVTVRQGTAARIATGARLPDGADAVIPVEATTPLDASGAPGPRGRDATGPVPTAVLVHEPVAPGGSVRAAGSDLAAGASLLKPGIAITAAAVALITGAGVDELLVHDRPRVAVLATGDEIRAPGEPLGPAGIPDANGPGLRALVTASGGEALDLGIATDDVDDVLDRLRRGLAAGADALIVSGGVSVGPYDVVKTAIEAIGRIDLWRVAVQPGKPFAFGSAERPGGGAPRPRLWPARQSGLVGGDLRAVRSACDPAPRRQAGSAQTGRPRGPRRARDEEPRAAGVPARGGRAR